MHITVGNSGNSEIKREACCSHIKIPIHIKYLAKSLQLGQASVDLINIEHSW